jgi:hypothetical protein
MPVPTGYSASQLVFDDAFCGKELDGSKWAPLMPGFNDRGRLSPPLSGPNAGGSEAEYFDPSQVVVDDGLRLTTAPATTQTGYTAKSGVLTTQPSVPLGGGPTGRTYLQVRAKMPARDGMWPKVYLGPLVGSNATLVGLFATGFKDAPSGNPLSNIQTTVGNANGYFDTAIDLSTTYSDYGVEITWGASVVWFWSSVGTPAREVRRVQAAGSVPTSPDRQTLFIALSVVNGQDGSSGWHTVWNGKDTDTLSIAEVQIYAR